MKSSKNNSNITFDKKLSRLPFFDHLPNKVVARNINAIDNDLILHPATIKLGGLYYLGHINNDDDRYFYLFL